MSLVTDPVTRATTHHSIGISSCHHCHHSTLYRRIRNKIEVRGVESCRVLGKVGGDGGDTGASIRYVSAIRLHQHKKCTGADWRRGARLRSESISTGHCHPRPPAVPARRALQRHRRACLGPLPGKHRRLPAKRRPGAAQRERSRVANLAPVAQRPERLPYKRVTLGSIPAGGTAPPGALP